MENPIEKLRTMFFAKVSEIHSKSLSTPADWDELQVLVEANPAAFPDRIRTLVENHPTSRDSRSARADRILRVQKVIASIPDGAVLQDVPSDQSNLIPTFTVSMKESERIFELCDQMRRIILASVQFDQPHRVRLLNRIAAIESETQKPEGMYDVVRAGISDLGETLGKFGTDIKPLTERMKEVVGIARKGSKQYEQLPSPEEVKQLPPPDTEAQE